MVVNHMFRLSFFKITSADPKEIHMLATSQTIYSSVFLYKYLHLMNTVTYFVLEWITHAFGIFNRGHTTF